MQKLKKKVKKPTDILQQINNKVSKESLILKDRTYGIKKNGIIVSVSSKDHFLGLSSPDNYCCISPNTSIKITNFIENAGNVFIRGKRIVNMRNFFQ